MNSVLPIEAGPPRVLPGEGVEYAGAGRAAHFASIQVTNFNDVIRAGFCHWGKSIHRLSDCYYGALFWRRCLILALVTENWHGMLS